MNISAPRPLCTSQGGHDEKSSDGRDGGDHPGRRGLRHGGAALKRNTAAAVTAATTTATTATAAAPGGRPGSSAWRSARRSRPNHPRYYGQLRARLLRAARPSYGYGPGYYRTCETTRWVWDPYVGRRVPVREAYAC